MSIFSLMVATDLDHFDLLFVEYSTLSATRLTSCPKWLVNTHVRLENSSPRTYTCLRGDYLLVNSKYDGLQATSDAQALKHWTEERHKAVACRRRSSFTLSRWFGAWLVKSYDKSHMYKQQARRARLNELLLGTRNCLEPISCIWHKPNSEFAPTSLLIDSSSSGLEVANVVLPEEGTILPSFPCLEDILDLYPGLRFITTSLPPGKTFELQLKARNEHIL
ncbi:hypothetical protein B0J17DRAFT_220900 [Rhizoctonia solani]|nr:hypothetical protein B0J17DRAFT_220900 [Rhizoctonia solani]